MSAKSIEFCIDAFDDRECFTVLGRNCEEQLDVGDAFDAIYRNKKRRTPVEYGEPPVRVEEHAVSLRVVCAHAYGRSVPALGEGMTGSITLEGEGLDRIGAGWILGRSSAFVASHAAPEAARPTV